MDNNYQLLSLLGLWVEHNLGQAIWVFIGIIFAILSLCIFVGGVCWNIAKSHSEGSIDALKDRLALKDDQEMVVNAALKTAEKRIAELEALPRDAPGQLVAATTSAAYNAVNTAQRANNDPAFVWSLGKEAAEFGQNMDDFVKQLIKSMKERPITPLIIN